MRLQEIKSEILKAIEKHPTSNKWDVYLGANLDKEESRTITKILKDGGFNVTIEENPPYYSYQDQRQYSSTYNLTIQGPMSVFSLDDSLDPFIANIRKIFENTIETIKKNIHTAIEKKPAEDQWLIPLNKSLLDGYVHENITNLLKAGDLNFEIENHYQTHWHDDNSFTIQIYAPHPSSNNRQDPFNASIYKIFENEIERIKQKILSQIHQNSASDRWCINLDTHLCGYVREYITNLLKAGDLNFEIENHYQTHWHDDNSFTIQIDAPAPYSNNYQKSEPFIRSIYDCLKSDQKRTTTTNARPNEPFPNIQVTAFQDIKVPKGAVLGNVTVSGTITPPKPNTQERIVTPQPRNQNSPQVTSTFFAVPTQVPLPVAAPKQIAEEIPEDFICPITHEVMENPVIFIRDRLSYEKSDIRDWLLKAGTSPITRDPMLPGDTVDNVLVENFTLKKIITAFKIRNPSLFSDAEEDGNKKHSIR
jgi:U-box domain